MPDLYGRESVPVNLDGYIVQVDQAELHKRVNELVGTLGVMHPISRYLVEGLRLDVERHLFDGLIEDVDASLHRYKVNGGAVKYPITLMERVRKGFDSAQRWDDF